MDKMVEELKMDKVTAESEEKTAQKEYVELMKESGEARTASQKSLVEKQNSRAELDTRLQDTKTASTGAIAELENAHKMTDSLHKTCDFLVKNFEAQHDARVAEEENLKE